jgi:uncharacterized protein YjiS (DUF1127 family)
MIMSTNPGAIAAQYLAWLWIGPAILANAIKSKCVAFIAWRTERAAVAQLQMLSDRTLKDIGLTRSQIRSAVRGESTDTLPF